MDALITRKGGLGEINFTSAILANSVSNYSITTDRDYDLIVFSNANSSSRNSSGGLTITVTGYEPITKQNKGNYGYNSDLGHDNDQTGNLTIFENVKSGTEISVRLWPGFSTSICVGIYKR